MLGLSDEIGTLQVGRSADLVVLDGNPLDSTSAWRQRRYVMLAGEIRTPEEWLENYKGAVNTAPDLDALANVQQKASKALDKLKVEHPALYEEAIRAGKDRADALNPTEGRADTDMGEAHAEETEEAPF